MSNSIVAYMYRCCISGVEERAVMVGQSAAATHLLTQSRPCAPIAADQAELQNIQPVHIVATHMLMKSSTAS
jgi:hypothetical protein